MNKYLLLIVSIFAFVSASSAQTWQKSYFTAPASKYMQCYDYSEKYGGLICVNTYNVSWLDASDHYVIRINRYGDTVWTKLNFMDVGSERAVPCSIAQLSNGDYVLGVCKYIYPNTYGNTVFIRIDSNGNLKHTRNGGRDENIGKDINVISTSDGGYFLSYSCESYYNVDPMTVNVDVISIIERYDSMDKLQWSTQFKDTYCAVGERVTYIEVFPYTTLFTTGLAGDGIGYVTRGKIARLYADGTLCYENSMSPVFAGEVYCNSMKGTSDTGIIADISDNNSDHLCKINNTGHLTTFMPMNNNFYLGQGTEISNGNYLMAAPSIHGFYLYDNTFKLLDSIASPFLENEYTYFPLIANQHGGAFCAYISDSGGVSHTFAVNFDSFYNYYPDLKMSMYSNCLVPGDTCHLHMQLYNNSTRRLDSTTATVILDSSTVFISSKPAPISISGDTLVFHIDTLQAMHTDSMLINIYVDSSLGLGTLLTFNGLSPFVNRPANSDDTIVYYGTTVSSLDPNFKSVNRQYNFTADKPLVYTVGFENTGNHFAKKVVILDTIDNHLDPSTLKVLGGSPKMPDITWSSDHVVKFSFNDIHLPDSLSDPEASRGQVVYSIKAKDGTALGTPINNTAYIFFDYNDAVVTNTTSNVISMVDGPKRDTVETVRTGISIYPNPSTGAITIALPTTGDGWNVIITDISGKVVMKNSYADNLISMNPKIPHGLYFLKITSLDRKQSFIRKITRE